ncbi:hypothetical protein ACHHY8_02525 [Enterobacter cloacae complex sp. 2024EL-00215]|uniref:phage scaffolding protein n=1 Tax=unclassified Enterobacter cloacae complex TaxID=2757714 RepID=UPI0037500F80
MVDETNETQQQQTQQQQQEQQQHRQQQKMEEKTTFSLEYVQELRAENAKYRTSAKEAREQLDAAQNDAKKKSEEADQKVQSAEKAANARIIRAELKAVAVKAGMVDLDGLKLADLSSVTLGEDGEVTGAEDLMAKLKEAKPYLFAEPSKSTTNTDVRVPPKKEPEKFNASKATPEELRAKAKELGLNIKV